LEVRESGPNGWRRAKTDMAAARARLRAKAAGPSMFWLRRQATPRILP